MQAWIIDANDMDAEDILNFQSNLLHPNPDIRSFLKPENKGTSIVIAPKGDVKGYSAIMRDGVRNKAFNEVFDAIVSEFGTALDYAQKSQGDSLLLIDANPVKVLTAAQNIQRDLRRSEFRSEIRFAGDAGFVDIAGDTHEKQLYGMAIQNAARLEPHVAPGHIYVTEEFRRRLEEGFGKQLPFGLVTVGPEDLKELETKEGLFNIAKRGGEAEILTAIYRIE